MPTYPYPYPSDTWPFQGVDYSGISHLSAPLAKQMVTDGIKFVGRYLYPTQTPHGKGISKAEAEMYLNAGLAIFLYYEVNTSDALGGWNSGFTNGVAAHNLAVSLGVPQGTAIVCCCDTSVSDSQAAGVVMQYLEGFASQLTDYKVGIYGGLNVMQACYTAHPDLWRVQAGAWGSEEFSDIDVRQWFVPRNNDAKNDGYIKIDNITIDSNGYAKWRGNSVDLLSAPSLAFMWGGSGSSSKMPIWFYLKHF